MFDSKVVVDKEPKSIIGRIYNELRPSTNEARVPVQHEIGRINNELHPSTDQAEAPIQHEIGRINNELVDK